MTADRNVRRLVLLLLAVITAAPVAGQPERFTVGVMRRDGIILPFAAFDGDWSLPWPVSARNLEIPVTLEAVPAKWWGGRLPSAWTLWQNETQESTGVKPIAPLAIMVGFEKRVGVRTDFVSREEPVPPFALPYPKGGLVVAGDVKIGQIATVSKRAAVWRDLTTSLQDAIEEAEQKTLNVIRANTRWEHPLSKEERRSIVAELEAWYSTSLEQPGFGLSYIEAVNKYPPRLEDKGCGLETFISVWVHTNIRDRRPKPELTAAVTYCDRNGVSYMLPLGQLRVRNRTHWVFQLSSSEREWYAVVEATPGRVKYVAEYYGGGRRLPF